MDSSSILVISYENHAQAQQARFALLRLQSAGSVVIDDLTLISKSADGKVILKQDHRVPWMATIGGAVLGIIFGMIFSVPYIGAGLGVAAGALGGLLAATGLNIDFMSEIGKDLQPATTALFMHVRQLHMNQLLPALADGGGKIVHTSLPRAQEKILRQAFAQFESFDQRDELLNLNDVGTKSKHTESSSVLSSSEKSHSENSYFENLPIP
ncbi:MAG: DUF1269 domain-containing protein [Proteobacteria bacterium]|nr:MAG: DUF1269 domain-containing protein [Pseudomonadota bacterium]